MLRPNSRGLGLLTSRFPASVPLAAAAVLQGALLAASAADTVPPPASVNLRVLQLGPTPNRISLQWNAVTDTGGSGLKEYILYRNGLEITFDSLTGAKYRIESSSNLTTWSLVRTNLLAPGPVTTNTLPGSGALPANYFRARVDDLSR